MTDTPIIDAAIRAGCDTRGDGTGCEYPKCAQGGFECRPALTVLAALRIAMPWEPFVFDRAEALMRELYPAKFDDGQGFARRVAQAIDDLQQQVDKIRIGLDKL